MLFSQTYPELQLPLQRLSTYTHLSRTLGFNSNICLCNAALHSPFAELSVESF